MQNNLDGFIPGEGAAFVLLAKRAAAHAANLNALATIRGGGRSFESGHLGSEQPYQGNGLADAVQQLVGAASGHLPVREVYSSMNGESYWAKEWGVAFLRSRPAFAESHGMHHPADCYGDTGAAAGPLMVGLAALGVAGAYRASTVMIYASSDSGERAAMLITT
jgi:3-oxoacyl-[acyl-carrier-protein] synthase-1